MDKLKQWLDLAKNMHGGDFWGNIFDQEFAKEFMNDPQFKAPFTRNGPNASETPNKTTTFPAIDIIEGEEEVIIIIEVAGIIKENIELGLNGNILTVKGNAQPVHPHLKITYSERFYGEFQRQITLPDTINPSDISAKFWNGLLIVRYERRVEKGEIIPID
ncbi:Hsp20/alpha crystallin family protein [Bacillus sp. JJ1764]|uniref:Hsp20/alpha crystallin family protein n=1 Tax=Bacillus sp. JJ1764 TaxID=3122964 RepID=UPI002FFEA05B